MVDMIARPGRIVRGQSRAASSALTGNRRSLLVALAIALLLGVAPSLASTPVALADRDDPAEHFRELMYPTTPTPTPEAPVAEATTGDVIAGFAMQFLGYSYVWAGNSPAGFDCSGFTQYVVLNTVGIDIGHGTEGQLAYGYPVAPDQLLPGDLLYFAGTWGLGVSHAGIYIGDGLFIHAENETTGVVISDLWGTYGGYYYTATRVW
ncbi:MAG TPA: C40 family peptidase [Thermomicrobiales bacterium]|jgi:cell wall-associated NlpC family hydrolase|nr:C40 family peptidase [Thermomicrobiales bacterium]